LAISIDPNSMMQRIKRGSPRALGDASRPVAAHHVRAHPDARSARIYYRFIANSAPEETAMNLKNLAAVLLAFAIALPAFAQQAPTLYKRLGGYDAIAAVTDDFLARLAAEPQFSKFFAGHGTDSIKRIRQNIVDQLCAATGGPCIYVGRDMKTTHGGLGVTERDWDLSVKDLVATLDKFNVPAKEKDEVLSAISGLKRDIVEKP
jgi:hemoglobin